MDVNIECDRHMEYDTFASESSVDRPFLVVLACRYILNIYIMTNQQFSPNKARDQNHEVVYCGGSMCLLRWNLLLDVVLLEYYHVAVLNAIPKQSQYSFDTLQLTKNRAIFQLRGYTLAIA